MRVPDLHTAPKRYLIKLESFLRKLILFGKKIVSQDILKNLESTKFFEILKSNKTPNKCSTNQLKL